MQSFPRPCLIGMIHLPALPGSPRHARPMTEILERALRDALVLRDAGFDAVMIENYGDVPFNAGPIDPAAVAALAVVTADVRRAVDLPIGVNALRNDARAAMGIAAAAGASFIRVNIHTGVAATDQGMIAGRADETLRYRKAIGADVAVFADVHVKHATPISQPDIALAARDCAYRGLADALIVSGPATGQPTDPTRIERVKSAVPDRPVYVGSGATVDTIAALLNHCDGAIVGTHIKADGETSAPVDADRARAFVQAARR